MFDEGVVKMIAGFFEAPSLCECAGKVDIDIFCDTLDSVGICSHLHCRRDGISDCVAFSSSKKHELTACGAEGCRVFNARRRCFHEDKAFFCWPFSIANELTDWGFATFFHCTKRFFFQCGNAAFDIVGSGIGMSRPLLRA